MKKILILYTAIGQGHKVMAENIAAQFKSSEYSVRSENILTVQKNTLSRYGEKLYLQIMRSAPGIWRWLYTSRLVNSFGLPVRIPLARKNSSKALDLIKEFQPDCIITTQTTASAIISFLKQSKQYSGLFGIAFSDYHLHEFWLYPAADFYAVNIIEQKHEMIALGIPAEKIFITGMSIRPAQLKAWEELKSSSSVAQAEIVTAVRPFFLFLNGSLGIGLTPQWYVAHLQKLFTCFPQAEAGIVCGTNETFQKALEKALQQQLWHKQVHVYGFYNNLPALMAQSTIIFTKPGGMTISELLGLRKPVVVTYVFPGQEDKNVLYLKKQNLIFGNLMEESIDSILERIEDQKLFTRYVSHLEKNKHISYILQGETQVDNIVYKMFHNV